MERFIGYCAIVVVAAIVGAFVIHAGADRLTVGVVEGWVDCLAMRALGLGRRLS